MGQEDATTLVIIYMYDMKFTRKGEGGKKQKNNHVYLQIKQLHKSESIMTHKRTDGHFQRYPQQSYVQLAVFDSKEAQPHICLNAPTVNIAKNTKQDTLTQTHTDTHRHTNNIWGGGNLLPLSTVVSLNGVYCSLM